MISPRELKKNRKLSEYFTAATDDNLYSEEKLLRAMTQQDRQQYQTLKFKLDHAKADLARMSRYSESARQSTKREMAIIENDLKLLKQKYADKIR